MSVISTGEINVSWRGHAIKVALNPLVDTLTEDGYFASSQVRQKSREKKLKYALVKRQEATFSLSAKPAFLLGQMIEQWHFEKPGKYLAIIPFDQDVYICSLNNHNFVDIDYSSEKIVDIETALKMLNHTDAEILIAIGGDLTQNFANEGFELDRTKNLSFDSQAAKLFATAPLPTALTRAAMYHPLHAVGAIVGLVLFLAILFLPSDFLSEEEVNSPEPVPIVTGVAQIPAQVSGIHRILKKAQPLMLYGMQNVKMQGGIAELSGDMDSPVHFKRITEIAAIFPSGEVTFSGSQWVISNVNVIGHSRGVEQPTVALASVEKITSEFYQILSNDLSLTRSLKGSPIAFPRHTIDSAGGNLVTNTIRVESIRDLELFLRAISRNLEISTTAGEIINLECSVTAGGYTGASVTVQIVGRKTTESI